MPAIDDVTRRGAVYWWCRRVRFGAGDLPPTTVVTMVSLQAKEQTVARCHDDRAKRAVADEPV